MKTYIFACIHNAGRSQMAAAFFNQLADPTQSRALSAGTNPGPHIHPIVVEAMREVGIDLSSAHPQLLTDDLARNATLLITMGCGEACPYIPNLRREDWPLPDPKNLPSTKCASIRDQIRARVQALLRLRRPHRRTLVPLKAATQTPPPHSAFPHTPCHSQSSA